MKRAFFISLFSVCTFGLSLSTHAQSSRKAAYGEIYPKARYGIGWSVTDFVVNTFALEGHYRLNRNAFILGYGSVYGQYNVGNNAFDEGTVPINGYQLKGNHKFYISGKDKVFFSLVHGPVFQHYKLPYISTEWVASIEDGSTVYTLQDIERTYKASRLGYDARINFEYIANYFVVDFGVGFSYRDLVSDNAIPNGYEIEDQFNGIAYSGFRPSIQFKIGIYLDGFAY